MNFDLDEKRRKKLFEAVLAKIEQYYGDTRSLAVTPTLDITEIRSFIKQMDFNNDQNFQKAIDHVIAGLTKYIVHTPHPKYFGLYNPRANYAGILADLITAAFNPQMAAWSHAPFANEVEAHLIKEFAVRFGYERATADGVFTSGGAEANLTALLCGINHKYPEFASEGVFALKRRPVIFCSAETHHSVQKAAAIIGIGHQAVRTIPVNENMEIDTEVLESALGELQNDADPCIIIGTAGTTGVGAVDDLVRLDQLAKRYRAWFHIDAAYGGGAILSKKLRYLLNGIELSDSITFDAHKWMSVPMSASLFITSHKDILAQTFRSTTEYMPKEAQHMEVLDPYAHSIQWSRRFIGLKVYMSLLFFGWDGYESTIDHQVEIGHYLRKKLLENSWAIKNKTVLPVICFTDDRFEKDTTFPQTILDKILARRKSWLSLYPVQGVPTLRACITNYNTNEADIDELIEELNKARN